MSYRKRLLAIASRGVSSLQHQFISKSYADRLSGASNALDLSGSFNQGLRSPPTLRRCRRHDLHEFSTSASSETTAAQIHVNFVCRDGEEKKVLVPVGHTMLQAAHDNDIDLEGACEGSLACSTCHVVVMDEDMYDKLSEPTDEENDMLDLAFGLTEHSRLGCQIVASPEIDGIRLKIPSATRNFAVDGHVPKPH